MPGRVTFKKGAKFQRIEKKLESPERALKQIGVMLVAESQRAFKMQQFGDKKWDSRAPINVFGIIADFHAGRSKPPARRFEARPALRDTGRLASSIAFNVSGNTVEVGTNLDYAAVHQSGGKVESKPINEKVQQGLWRWLKSQDSGLKRRLGWLLNRKFRNKTLTATVPARPFIGITRKSRESIRKIVGVEIMEAE